MPYANFAAGSTSHMFCQVQFGWSNLHIVKSTSSLSEVEQSTLFPSKKRKTTTSFLQIPFFWLGRVIFRALFSKFHPLQDGAPVVSKLVYNYICYQSCIILQISHNVGKITINNPQNHHFLRWYVYHSQMVCL